MCGRFTLSAPSEEVAAIFGVDDVPELAPRFNVAPTQLIVVVRADSESHERRLVQLRWGLVPAWARDPAIGNKLINARAETVAEKASFKRAFESRRCLVVADGFYEWQKAGKGKQPFHIKMKDGKPFALAGLWERWDRGAEPLETCTILTTEPNALVKPIHRRMPVILDPAHWEAWLDPNNRDTEALLGMLSPHPAGAMVAQAVSKAVNNPKNDGPVCIEPVQSGDLFL